MRNTRRNSDEKKKKRKRESEGKMAAFVYRGGLPDLAISQYGTARAFLLLHKGWHYCYADQPVLGAYDVADSFPVSIKVLEMVSRRGDRAVLGRKYLLLPESFVFSALCLLPLDLFVLQ
jgi:hypothetical protein